MAATGKTPILLYGSTTATNAPVAGNLTNSSDGCEIAINVADKNLFFKDSTNAVNTVPIRQSNASSNGWLSSTDWSTFNGKAAAFTYTTNYIPYGQGTTTPAQSANLTFDGSKLYVSGNVGVGATAAAPLDVTADNTSAYVAILRGRASNNACVFSWKNNTATSELAKLTLDASNNFTWVNNSVNTLYLSSTGGVSIGNTTDAGAGNLNVSGKAAFTTTTNQTVGTFYLQVASSTSTPVLICRKYDNTNSTSQIYAAFQYNQGGNGNGAIAGNGDSQATFVSYSDKRLKQNVVDIKPQLTNIMKLRPVEFEYISNKAQQIGFIAQEVQEIYPDLVNSDNEGILMLAGLGKNEARLIKAMQEIVKKLKDAGISGF